MRHLLKSQLEFKPHTLEHQVNGSNSMLQQIKLLQGKNTLTKVGSLVSLDFNPTMEANWEELLCLQQPMEHVSKWDACIVPMHRKMLLFGKTEGLESDFEVVLEVDFD